MSPRNSGSVDSNLGLNSASQMQVSNLPVAQSAGEQSTSGEQSTAPCTAGTANNVSNANSAQSVVGTVGTVGAVGPSPASEGQDKRKLIQLQLVLLLHAYKCRINETQTNGEVRQCTLPNCSTMKQVLAHMTTCQAGKSCTVPHCSSSSQIISHWKNCTQSDCPVCVPLKQAAGRRQQQAAAVQTVQTSQAYAPADMQRAYAALGLPYKSGGDGGNVNAILQRGQAVPGPNVTGDQGPHCSSQNMGHIRALQPTQQQNIQQSQLHLRPMLQSNNANVIPSSSAQNFLMNDNFQSKLNSTNVALLNPQNQVIPGIMNDSASSSKDWRQSVGQDLRQHLVQKIVQTIFPTIDVNTYRDSRMINLVAYAEKVENEMYKSANTREEYYQLLAEKIYKIQKELEEKRQSAKESQLQQQEVGSSLEPMLNNNSGTASPKFAATGVASQSHLPGSSNSEIQQRMPPPNITVSTNLGARNSELFTRSQLANSLNPNMNIALSQNQFNQSQARQNALNANNLQQQQLQQQLQQQQQQQQQQFNNINPSVTTITIPSGEQSPITSTVSDISVSQFNSTIHKNHAQMTSSTLQQNQMQMSSSALQQNQMQMINSSVSQNHLQLTNSPLQQNHLPITNTSLQQNQVQMTNSSMHPNHLQMTPSLQQNHLQMSNTSLQQNQQMQYAFNSRQIMSPHQQSRMMGQVNQEQLVVPQNIKAQIQMISQNQQQNQIQQQNQLQQQQSQIQQHNNQLQQQSQLQQQQQNQIQQQNQLQQFSSQQLQSHLSQLAPTSQPGLSPQMFAEGQVTQSLTPQPRSSLDFQQPASQQPSRPGSVPGPSPQTPSNPQTQQSSLVEQHVQGKAQLPQQSSTSIEENEDFQPRMSGSQEDTSSVNQINNTSMSTPISSDQESSSGKHFGQEPSGGKHFEDESSIGKHFKQESSVGKQFSQDSSQASGKNFGFSMQTGEDSFNDVKSVKMEVDGDVKRESGRPGAMESLQTEIKVEIKEGVKEPMEEGEQIPTSSSATEPAVKQEPVSPKPASNSGVKQEIKQEQAGESSQPPKLKPNRKIFKPDELRQALMPTLENLYKQDPESLPFRQPVDPQLLGIPDYFDIIKKPMDLSTIKRKLDTGQYQDPWQYIDDVNLMFSNAWTYNRKTSKVYKHCTKLAEVFEQDIDPVMLTLGYCCGRKYVFQPQILCCYGKQLCTIARDSKYWSYQNRYTYCQKCFSDIPGDSVSLEEDPTQPPLVIKKEKFVEMKNNHLDLEPFIECSDCGRKVHQICVLHFEQIWPEGFTCDNCLKNKGKKRKENKFTSKRLQQTKLGQYIENRVNNYIRKSPYGGGAGEVTIRVVSSSEKYSEVKPEMKARFVDSGELPERFPYRAKALFAFEEIDGVDTCFFGMHVQEYGSDCSPPNARRVYIAYLDSVHFFQPKQLRTPVYHEILLGYLDYAKLLGYTMAHIWACPPSEGDDYIFHCHPSDQKIPKPKRLQDWYKKMLDKGMADRVVMEYKDILKQATEDNLTSAAELPYFDDDFWPNVLEESIKELEQEVEEKRRLEASAAEEAARVVATASDVNESEDDTANGKKKGQKSGRNKKANKNKNNQKKNKKSTYPYAGNDLTAKIISMMEKHKEVFFVIRLQSVKTALPPIVDPDPFIACEMMDGRDTFLTLAREKHYEFSSMRRTKFSTMAMLYQLHNQGQDQFVYTCNNCKSNVETRFHCTVCDDFDLCIKCYTKDGHCHKMQRLGFELGDDSAGGDQKQVNPQESRKLAIQRCIISLEHACQCRDANCRLPSCQKMKRIVSHAKTCKRKGNGSCAICKQLIALNCYHAKNCQETKCPVPFCLNIKYKLKQQRMQQQQILKRRIATTQNRGMTEAIRQTSPGSSSQTNQPSPDNKPLTSPHVPQPGIGMKPSACPPVGALQAVQQVQAAAARQSVPHMVASTRPAVPHMVGPGSYGNNTMVNHPTANPALMRAQQQQQLMQKPMTQMMPGQPNRMMGMRNMSNWDNSNFNQSMQPQGAQPGQPMGLRPQSQMMGVNNMPNPAGPSPGGVGLPQVMSNPGTSAGTPMQQRSNAQVLQQLLTSLKSSNFPQQKQQVLHILKSNPQLMAAFIKQRQQPQQQQQQQQQPQPPPQQQQQQQQVMNERAMIGQPLPQPGPGPGRVWQQQQQQRQQHQQHQQQQLLAMQRQQLQQQQQQQGSQPNQFPQPPMYTQRPRMPMQASYGQFQNDNSQFQFQQQQQRQQLLMSNPQIKQMTSPTHPPASPQQGIYGLPQAASIPSPSQLMQQVRSPSPTTAQLTQALCSPQPIASPRTQASAFQNQPIPSPRQHQAPSPIYPAQTQSPHLGLTSRLAGPEQLGSRNDMMLTHLTNSVSSHPNIASQLQNPINQELGPPRDNLDLDHLTREEQLKRFVDHL